MLEIKVCLLLYITLFTWLDVSVSMKSIQKIINSYFQSKTFPLNKKLIGDQSNLYYISSNFEVLRYDNYLMDPRFLPKNQVHQSKS